MRGVRRNRREKMSNEVREPEERRLAILKGIGQDFNILDIASQLGVNKFLIMSDLRYMRHIKDFGLKQANEDRFACRLANKLSLKKISNEKIRLMIGMTIEEKNFENVVNFYRSELMKILESKNEELAIKGLSKSVRKTFENNEIIDWRKNNHLISQKARAYLSHVNLTRESSKALRKSRAGSSASARFFQVY
jgi:hypothetical protein